MAFLKKITSFLGDSNDKALKDFDSRLLEVNAFEAEVSGLSDQELRAKTEYFRTRLSNGDTLDEILPEAFAVVKNGARRMIGHNYPVCDQPMTWDMVHFDVQLIGGI